MFYRKNIQSDHHFPRLEAVTLLNEAQTRMVRVLEANSFRQFQEHQLHS